MTTDMEDAKLCPLYDYSEITPIVPTMGLPIMPTVEATAPSEDDNEEPTVTPVAAHCEATREYPVAASALNDVESKQDSLVPYCVNDLEEWEMAEDALADGDCNTTQQYTAMIRLSPEVRNHQQAVLAAIISGLGPLIRQVLARLGTSNQTREDVRINLEVICGHHPTNPSIPGMENQVSDTVVSIPKQRSVSPCTQRGHTTEIVKRGKKYGVEEHIGAGITSGVVGMLVGGPFLGLVLAAGAVCACSKDGTAGDIARAVADFSLVAKDKAQEINRKHRIVKKSKTALKKSKTAAIRALTKVQEAERQHRIMEHSRAALICSFHVTSKFMRENVINPGIAYSARALRQVIQSISEEVKRLMQSYEATPQVEDTPRTRYEAAPQVEDTPRTLYCARVT